MSTLLIKLCTYILIFFYFYAMLFIAVFNFYQAFHFYWIGNYLYGTLFILMNIFTISVIIYLLIQCFYGYKTTELIKGDKKNG